VVKNYSTPIWSRVLALLELLGTALVHTQYSPVSSLQDRTPCGTMSSTDSPTVRLYISRTSQTSCIANGARQYARTLFCVGPILGFGSNFGLFSYFRWKIWRHILARRPRFPMKATKFRDMSLSFRDLTRDRQTTDAATETEGVCEPNMTLNTCWNSVTCEPLDACRRSTQLHIFSMSHWSFTVKFGITGYYYNYTIRIGLCMQVAKTPT